MRKLLITIIAVAFSFCGTAEAVAGSATIKQCQDAARANYPLIKRYDLIRLTADCDVDNIAKGWLPQVSATAQATVQSAVSALPDVLSSVMQQMDTDARGLSRFQYKIGVDVAQTIYEGGVMRNRKAVDRLQADVETAQTDVNIYNVYARVNELYFGVLLLDERLRINHEMQTLLSANLDKLRVMLRDGVAMECDVNSLDAQLREARRDESEMRSSRTALLSILSVFCGISIDNVEKPQPVEAQGYGEKRPEMELFNSQLRLADARESLLDAMLKPRVSAFASGYYGYMGYDMFRDMFHRNPTLNGMVGIKVTWTIGNLYTRKNDKAKLQLQRQLTENSREVFLFNTALDKLNSQAGIDKYRKLMADDEAIVGLREKVRRAAESKLRHGIIDVNGLLQELTRENEARIQQSLHEVKMLKEMYDMKTVTNE